MRAARKIFDEYSRKALCCDFNQQNSSHSKCLLNTKIWSKMFLSQGFMFDCYNIEGKFFLVCQLVIFDEGSRMHVIIRTRAYT